MKISKILAVGLLSLAAGNVNAQQSTNTYSSNDGNLGFVVTRKMPSQPATGTQYYIENFNAARIGDSKELTLARYNAYSDEIEVKIDNDVMVVDPSENIYVTLTNGMAQYKYVQYMNKEGNASQNFLVVVSASPKVNIFKKERIELQAEQQPTGGYQRYKAANYAKLAPHYFIQLNEGRIVYLSDKKKDLYGLVPGKENEIKAFVKENKIDADDDADLKKLAEYVSTLL